MQEMFEFDWIFDYLSLGTTFLYRYYVAPPVIGDRRIKAKMEFSSYNFKLKDREQMWRTTWARAQRNLDSHCNAAYPNLVPAKRLRILDYLPKDTWNRPDSRDDKYERPKVQHV